MPSRQCLPASVNRLDLSSEFSQLTPCCQGQAPSRMTLSNGWIRMAGAAACVAALAFVEPCSAQTFSLNEALATAYQTNPQLDSERAALRATDEGVAQANAGWRPSVNLQGSYGYQCLDESAAGSHPATPCAKSATTKYTPLTGGLTITQPLFRGGQTYAEVGRAKAQVGVGRAQLMLTEENVFVDTVTSYMDVVRDTQTVIYREQNVAALQQQLNDTQTEANVGEQTKTDVAQAQARLAVAQSDLATARAQLHISRANFEQTVGRSAETLERLPKLPPLPPSLDEALRIADTRNPNMIGARDNELAAKYQVDDAVGALMPQAQVQAQYNYSQGAPEFLGGLGTQRTTAIVGQVTVPIYQGGGDEATVRRAKELHAQALAEIVQADRQVRQAVKQAWEAFQAARLSIASDQTAVSANRTAYEGVKAQQKLGDRTTLDVLNAAQELYASQIALAQAEHDMVVAAFQLLSATGQLTARNLALRVNYYDPLEHYNEDADAWFGFGDPDK